MAKKGYFKLNDQVIVKKDIIHAKKGEIGTVVYIYKSGDYNVKFADKTVYLLTKEIKLYEKV